MSSEDIEIVDITKSIRWEHFLYRCLAPMPFHQYQRRSNYVELAVSLGFHKKVLFWKGKAIGVIEYAPVESRLLPGLWQKHRCHELHLGFEKG